MKKVIVVLVGVLAIAGSAQGNTTQRMGVAIVKGENAYATLSGDANNAAQIEVIVNSVPSQSVDVSWSIYCYSDDFDDSGSKSRDFTDRTPIDIYLPIPIRDADFCSVNVNGFLNDDGKLKITVYKTPRN